MTEFRTVWLDAIWEFLISMLLPNMDAGRKAQHLVLTGGTVDSREPRWSKHAPCFHAYSVLSKSCLEQVNSVPCLFPAITRCSVRPYVPGNL